MASKASFNDSRDVSREKQIHRKAIVVRTALAVMTIANVLIFAYVGSVIYSVAKTSYWLDDNSTYQYNVNNILDPNDDTIDLYTNLSLGNHGLYPIQTISLHMDVYIHNGTYAGTHFATLDQTIPTIVPGNTTNLTLTLAVDAGNAIILYLKFEDVLLRTEFVISTAVQQFPVRVNGTSYQVFDSGL